MHLNNYSYTKPPFFRKKKKKKVLSFLYILSNSIRTKQNSAESIQGVHLLMFSTVFDKIIA